MSAPMPTNPKAPSVERWEAATFDEALATLSHEADGWDYETPECQRIMRVSRLLVALQQRAEQAEAKLLRACELGYDDAMERDEWKDRAEAAEQECERLRADARRWVYYATSPQTALSLGSVCDPNSGTMIETDWYMESSRLADAAMTHNAANAVGRENGLDR